MKYHIKIATFCGFITLFLTSCEKVVDIDLNSTDPKLVITGSVSDQLKPFAVRIEKTVNFDEPDNYPAVSGATVRISDGTLTFDLLEKTPGIYQTPQPQKGEPGKTYRLTVEAEGKIFEALSTMPTSVPFDSIKQDKGRQSRGGSAILIVPVYSDPVGLGNYYRFVQTNNGQRLNNIFVFDDRNNDGIVTTQPLFTPGSDIENTVGDTVIIEMQSIDRATYKYFYALGASSGDGPNASVPANPDNNWNGKALGYFSAHTSQYRTYVIR
jgi:hypothetical protein